MVQFREKIARYKEEYAELIKAAESLKQDMELIIQKCGRGGSAGESAGGARALGNFRGRAFRASLRLVGDVVLGGAFLAYFEYFDLQRMVLLHDWRDHLDRAGVPYNGKVSMVEYLSRAAQRIEWASHGLPSDDLCIENAIVLDNFQRYPLIIDPSGQATRF